jgi:hypothetical protein
LRRPTYARTWFGLIFAKLKFDLDGDDQTFNSVNELMTFWWLLLDRTARTGTARTGTKPTPGPQAIFMIGIAAFHGVGVVPIFKKADAGKFAMGGRNTQKQSLAGLF